MEPFWIWQQAHSINKIWLYSPMLGGNKKRAFAEYDCFTNANSSLLRLSQVVTTRSFSCTR